jgi:drug/metabolite transporter (DMT)-like permease
VEFPWLKSHPIGSKPEHCIVAQARKSDILLLAFNSFVWGTGWSAIKYSLDQMGPVALNVWTLGISLFALFPFVYAEYRRKQAIKCVLRERDYFDYAVMGFLGLMGMTLLYNWGAGLSLAVNGALITTMVPILTALIAVVILRERLTRARVLGLIIALAGVLIISDIHWGSVSFLGPYLFGNLVLLGGAVGNAIYVVFGKRLLERSGPMTVLFWGQALGFVGSLPFLYFDPFHLNSVRTYTLYTWLALLFLGTIFYSFTVVIFFRILVRLDAGQIMVFAYLQPVFGVIMATILLEERFTVNMVIGGLLVIGGTLFVTFERPTPIEIVTQERS